MADWTPERQVRFERSRKARSLEWKCLLCRRELQGSICPHSLAEHREAVDECRTIALTRKARA